jgi:dTDP-4-dehydrorhamnose 3,5-epimerase
MKLLPTPLPGLQVVDTEPVGDARGRFERLFCEQQWALLREDLRFVQVNLSTTARRGTVRGMHYQHAPAAEDK